MNKRVNYYEEFFKLFPELKILVRTLFYFKVKMELMGGAANNVATPFPVASMLSMLFYCMLMKNSTLGLLLQYVLIKMIYYLDY